MHSWVAVFFFIAINLIASNKVVASQSQDHVMFTKLFSMWTDAFNHKDLAGSCHLFSPDMVANYQGAPLKNYTSVCDGFKKIFHENRDYQYRFKLHQVYRSNELAAVRITWYLQISEHGKLISDTQDEGIDIFKQDAQGHWKIINYLAYPIAERKR